MTAYCTANDVKARIVGNPVYMPTLFDAVIGNIIDAVSAELDREIAKGRGISAPWSFIADSIASARLYTGKPGNVRLLPIDDCIAVTSAVIAGATLVLGTDYQVFPLNGAVITALIRINGTWSQTYAGISVSAKWGCATTAPRDLWNAAVVESVRGYLAAREGENDTIGMTPFGSMVTSKAFTSKTWQLIQTYGHGAGYLR